LFEDTWENLHAEFVKRKDEVIEIIGKDDYKELLTLLD